MQGKAIWPVFIHYKQLCKFIGKCKRLDKKGFQPPRDWYLETEMASAPFCQYRLGTTSERT